MLKIVSLTKGSKKLKKRNLLYKKRLKNKNFKNKLCLHIPKIHTNLRLLNIQTNIQLKQVVICLVVIT